jgi:hypothetical protein
MERLGGSEGMQFLVDRIFMLVTGAIACCGITCRRPDGGIL